MIRNITLMRRQNFRDSFQSRQRVTRVTMHAAFQEGSLPFRCLFLIHISLQSTGLKVSLQIDKRRKQKILSYLKTIYENVPMNKLFKRCLHQMNLCRKAIAESENAGQLSAKGSFKNFQAPRIEGNNSYRRLLILSIMYMAIVFYRRRSNIIFGRNYLV